MIGRLMLVIHWAGFLASVFGITSISYAILIYGRDFPSRSEYEMAALVAVPVVIGWLIRFVVMGHRSILPWVANEEFH